MGIVHLGTDSSPG